MVRKTLETVEHSRSMSVHALLLIRTSHKRHHPPQVVMTSSSVPKPLTGSLIKDFMYTRSSTFGLRCLDIEVSIHDIRV
eukprot:8039035-Pyramimonas_sp.AAC.2